MPENIDDKNETYPAPADIEKPKSSWIWLKDASGFPSVTTTFATVAFWVTTLAYVASIFEKIGPLQVRAFDPAACASFMGPIMGLYFGRKFTDAKFSVNK